jgi:hypothetical protein
MFILFVFFGAIHQNVLSKSKQNQDHQNIEQASQEIDETSEQSFFKKIGDWTEKTWQNFQSLFNKKTRSIQEDVKETFEQPSSQIKQEWSDTARNQKAIVNMQKSLTKIELAIHEHLLDADDLILEIQEDTSDSQSNKLVRRYYKQASKSEREAESGRRDTDFLLNNLVREYTNLENNNYKNYELLEMYKNELLEYQRDYEDQELE